MTCVHKKKSKNMGCIHLKDVFYLVLLLCLVAMILLGDR